MCENTCLVGYRCTSGRSLSIRFIYTWAANVQWPSVNEDTRRAPKSHFARQIRKEALIYIFSTSILRRICNFLHLVFAALLEIEACNRFYSRAYLFASEGKSEGKYYYNFMWNLANFTFRGTDTKICDRRDKICNKRWEWFFYFFCSDSDSNIES